MTDEFDDVLTQLEPLRFTPDRSEAAARSGLQDFLSEAARLHPTVSARPAGRLTGWKIKSVQERSPMLALAIKLVLVLAVLLGGVGVAAAAAQNSLPDEALYPIKLLLEEAQLSLASTPDTQLDAHLAQAQQRVREMTQLSDRGTDIPAAVPARLQTQLQAALQIAAQLDDPQMQAALTRLQLRTQDQLREMDRLHVTEAVQALTHARELAQLGQRDPQLFRARMGHGRPAGAPPQPQHTPRADPSRTPPGPRASATPSPSHTPQPQPTHTPQGQGYGPGPQTQSTPQGQSYGPGPQAQSTPQGSGGSEMQNTPAPGGSGPGPGQGSNDGSGGSDGGGSGTGGTGGSGGSGDGGSGGGGGGGGGSGGVGGGGGRP